MSQYKPIWASCKHGKRNSRVCVECYQQAMKQAARNAKNLPPPIHPTDEQLRAAGLVSDIELIAPGMTEDDFKPRTPEQISEEILNMKPAPTLASAYLRHEPAIDRRDHEWKPRPRRMTWPNLVSFLEYAAVARGWRT